jgi:hypothetical protein
MIVAVSGGLLVAAFARAREAADRMQCQSNLRQIGIAAHTYHNDYDALPPPTMSNAELPKEKRLSWLFQMVPYIAADVLFSQADKQKGWEAEENRKVALAQYKMYLCPCSPDRSSLSTLAFTDYIGITGIGVNSDVLPKGDPKAGPFWFDPTNPKHRRTLKEIADNDGTSSTLFAVETLTDNGPWIAGGYPTCRGLEPERPPYLGPTGQFSSRHRVTNVVFADCSTRGLRPNIDPGVFEALATYAGGEAVTLPDD